MAKALLSWTNLADASGVVLSASDQAGDLSPSNVVDPIIGRRLRVTITGWLQVDLGANDSMFFMALRFPRDTPLPTAGTVQHQLDADGGTPGAGAVYDSGAIAINTSDGYGYHFHLPSSAQTARYARVTFNITGISFIDVGRFWLGGEAFRPTFDVSGGYEDRWEDLSLISVAERAGAEYVDERARRRLMAFGFDALSQAERDTLREMNRLAGTSQQILFCLDTDTPETETVLGRMSQTPAIQHRALSQQLYRQAIEIRESL